MTFRDARVNDGGSESISMAERVYSDYSAAEHYATFCNALAGLEDDAALEGYSQEGRELLLRALKVFDQDRRERHGS